MGVKKKDKAPSLLDSTHYQNALRVNFVESNRLHKIVKAISTDQQRAVSGRDRKWENTQIWRQNVQTTTGKADLTKYDKLLATKAEEDEDVAPDFYFLYGVSIGERPKLMKDFLGKQRKQESKEGKIPDDKEDCNPTKFEQEVTDDNLSGMDSSRSGEQPAYNQIMIDNQVVTQVPIGYNKSCKKKSHWHTKCTSEGMKQANTRIPEYYRMKHKYILPPVNMFR